MKLIITTLAFLLVGSFAHAETWMTDSKKAIEIAQADNKPLIVWFAKSDTKFGDDFKNELSVNKAVLLKIEHGTKDADEWKGSNIAIAASGKNKLFVLSLNSKDPVGKPSWERAQQPLESAKVLSWKDLDTWYASTRVSTVDNSKALTLAYENLGKKVGNGESTVFGTGGAPIATVRPGGLIKGRIFAGAILELKNFRIRASDGKTDFHHSGVHYGVVECYDDSKKELTVLWQNTAGNPTVTMATLRLDQLSEGTIVVKEAK